MSEQFTRTVQVRDKLSSALVFEGPILQCAKLALELGFNEVLFDGPISEGFDPNALIEAHDDWINMIQSVEPTSQEQEDQLIERLEEVERWGRLEPGTKDEATHALKDARDKRGPTDVPDELPLPSPTPLDLGTEGGILKALARGQIDNVEFEDRRNEMVRAERIQQGRDPQTGIPFHELAARLGLTEAEVEERLSQR